MRMILILSLGPSFDTAVNNIVGAADDMGLQLNISKEILRAGEEGVVLSLDGKTQFWRTTKSLEYV